jgi:hypothetical protein
VGHFGVQLAKWKGALVVAVASGPHESFLRELGANEFIDYTTSRAEDVAHDIDLVLDAVGGPNSSRLLYTLKPGGSLPSTTPRRSPNSTSQPRRSRCAPTARRPANVRAYGLASYLYTRDVSRAHRMIDALDVGMTGINTGLISNAAAPFGGVKQSGTGREGGTEGLQEYLETRYAAFGGQTGAATTA